MSNRNHVVAISSQRGVTLMEIMVSMGLVGIVFMAIMSLLGTLGNFTGKTNSSAATIEGVSETVGLFTGVIPQATRITTCFCRGNVSNQTNCSWDSGNPWYDPVSQGGVAQTTAILTGEAEVYDGTQSLTQMSDLATSGISVPGGNCQAQASDMLTSLQRGCKQTFVLTYRAPVLETTSASTAGSLTLQTGSASHYAAVGAATVNGAGGMGISALSCGFDTSSGTPFGSVFVLNLRLKTKSNLITQVSANSYESWHPSGKNYINGNFRDVLLKFNMRNLNNRGLYFWKPLSLNDCKEVGATATSATQCCTQALVGTLCAMCLRSGTASASANSCCSGRLDSGGTSCQ